MTNLRELGDPTCGFSGDQLFSPKQLPGDRRRESVSEETIRGQL